MSFPERIHRSSAILLGLCVFACRLCAQTAGLENTNTPSTLNVSLRNEEFRGGSNERQVQRVYFTLGTNQFALTVPEGYRADASNPQKIVFSDVNSTCFITCHFTDITASDANQSQDDAFRDLALSQFPGGTVTDQVPASAAGHRGTAFELRRRNSFGQEESACMAFIPTVAGLMEFDLLANPVNFSNGRQAFKVLLSGVFSNEGGRLVIIRDSGQT